MSGCHTTRLAGHTGAGKSGSKATAVPAGSELVHLKQRTEGKCLKRRRRFAFRTQTEAYKELFFTGRNNVHIYGANAFLRQSDKQSVIWQENDEN